MSFSTFDLIYRRQRVNLNEKNNCHMNKLRKSFLLPPGNGSLAVACLSECTHMLTCNLSIKTTTITTTDVSVDFS